MHPPKSTAVYVLSLLLAGCADGGTSAPVVPAPVPAPAPTPLTVPANYQLVWADEFDVPGLPDASRWDYDTGRNALGWHNRELQYYSRARAENSVVRDGKLIITARKESLTTMPDYGGQKYSSARLFTQGKAQWTYGFVEVRAKLPCGKGSWPAIWMLGNGEWPAAGELDIMEQIGHEPTKVFSTVHTTSGSGGNGKGAATQVPDACGAFHNYQMLWTTNDIRFGIDGVEHFRYVNAGTGVNQWPFDRPQYLILNIAIGGDLGGAVDDSIFPIQFEIEHARVYQARP
ncbi:glycoside hydrolase family 16 protein [Chitinimonas sp. BJYL2]|uniref:glycoside hydrolase family 16 protein n=1 Tax=Chitinimonas sp. BJYL2 TaxID=2976696 RepID=UPI0022B58626|nr:glycoside hydrolase family 16 protein [Chitinimonas sp. BJYL2]